MTQANAQAEKKVRVKTELNLAQTISLLILLICGFMVVIVLFMGVFFMTARLFS